jgi:methylmalonyl-CoA carboxyltransferase 1.3S subunit
VKLKITIEDKTYEVDVEVAEQERRLPPGYVVEPAAVRLPAGPSTAPAPSSSSTPVNEKKVCRSPITGTVVRLVAQPGQSIQPGDILVVLEAMKMETNITAPVAGKIATIRVKAGDSVKAEQVVVELE